MQIVFLCLKNFFLSTLVFKHVSIACFNDSFDQDKAINCLSGFTRQFVSKQIKINGFVNFQMNREFFL